jgi:hypothetical protein
VKSPLSRKLVIGTTGFVLLGRSAAGRLRQPRADLPERRGRRRGNIALLGHRPGGGGVVAAQYLGIDQPTLWSELDSGRSLAELASSTPGRSVDGLRAAIMTAARERLDYAVSNGWITSDAARERLDDLPGRINGLLERRWVLGGADRALAVGPFGCH